MKVERVSPSGRAHVLVAFFSASIPYFTRGVITADAVGEDTGSAGPQIGEEQACVVREIAPADDLLSLFIRDPPN
jgi:hypothetical protein